LQNFGTLLTISKLIYCESLELGCLLGCQPKQVKHAKEMVSKICEEIYKSLFRWLRNMQSSWVWIYV
jgi:hypothetical protein